MRHGGAWKQGDGEVQGSVARGRRGGENVHRVEIHREQVQRQARADSSGEGGRYECGGSVALAVEGMGVGCWAWLQTKPRFAQLTRP